MKKTIPIAIRRVLEGLAQTKSDLFNVEFEKGSIITFKDTDTNTDFCFRLEKINVTGAKTSYSLYFKPSNVNNLEPVSTGSNLETIKTHFNNWLNLMTEINKKSPLFDDHITQSYYDEIEPEFDIIDKDAEYKTFSIKQQKLICSFLDKAQVVIQEQSKKDKDFEEVSELIIETKQDLSKTTKKKVIKNIRTIIAKGFKMGLQVGERLLIDFSTELGKKILLGNGQ